MPDCLHTSKEKLSYYKFGEGSPIVLLHGWGSSAELMLPISKAMPYYTYIVPDFYGHGRSPHPNYPLTVEDFAESIVKLLNEENIERATFVCHSFGGRVGIYLSTRYPNMVDRLILCDSAGLKPKRGIKYYIKRLNFIIRRTFGLNTDKCGSSEYRELNGVMKKTFSNVVNYFQDESLIKISSPTLVVWGEKDRVTPISMARKLTKNIANSKLVVIKGVGHFSYAEDLKTFKRAVEKFLEC